MSRARAFLKTLVVGAIAASLASVVALPHHHDASSPSHAAPACRICKVQEQLVATPEAPPAVHASAVPVRLSLAHQPQGPRSQSVFRSTRPRAPPRSS